LLRIATVKHVIFIQLEYNYYRTLLYLYYITLTVRLQYYLFSLNATNFYNIAGSRCLSWSKNQVTWYSQTQNHVYWCRRNWCSVILYKCDITV